MNNFEVLTVADRLPRAFETDQAIVFASTEASMRLASPSPERRKAQPLSRGATDSQRLLPPAPGRPAPRTQSDRRGVARPGNGEPEILERNAIGIATVWFAFYVIALVIAVAYQGSELLSQSLEIALLH